MISLAWDTAMKALERRRLAWMMGRPTTNNVNKSKSEIAADYAKKKINHSRFPFGSKFVFAVAILKE